MLRRQLLYVTLLILLSWNFLSCDTEFDTKEQIRFFDLKAFFEAETQRLAKLEKVKKTTSVNGKQETKEVAIDIGAELKIFAGSDINRVAWLDSYAVDSILGTDQRLQQLSYRALEEDLRTQSLQIYFSQDQVDSLTIFNKTTTAIANSSQQIRYVPAEGYAIRSAQDISFASTHALEVQVAFLD